MDSDPMLTDERMLAELDVELRSLIDTIRTRLSDLMASPGSEIATRFFSEAPVETCVRLADTWAVAEAIGLPLLALKAKFTAEDQLVLEIVTGIYSAGHAGRGQLLANDLPELARLVDELAMSPEMVASMS